MAKSESKLPDIGLKVHTALSSSPMLKALELEPHQLIVASAYMAQEGAKDLKAAYESVQFHCPADYDPKEDTRLTMFLVDYETIVRGAHLFSNHVLYAEAYRQYLKAVAGGDTKAQVIWFDRLSTIAPRVGGKEPAKRRRINLESS